MTVRTVIAFLSSEDNLAARRIAFIVSKLLLAIGRVKLRADPLSRTTNRPGNGSLGLLRSESSARGMCAHEGSETDFCSSPLLSQRGDARLAGMSTAKKHAPSDFPNRVATRFADYADRVWPYDAFIMLLLAALVGMLTGLGVALFRYGLDGLFNFAVLGFGGRHRWTLLILPAIGGLITALWIRLSERGNETGVSVAGIMEAVALHGGNISFRGSIARVVGAIFTVGLGGSAGPEDPSVQIGAAFGSQVARRLKLSKARIRTLVACGAAAGISAAFNAPIAGVFFAIEIILGEFSGASVSWIVLAAVAGTVTSQSILGNTPAFTVPRYEFSAFQELPLYMVLGILAAAVGVLYVKFMAQIESLFRKLRVPAWTKPCLGGLMVGTLAYFGSTAIMGTGYRAITDVLEGHETGALFLFSLVFLKLVATPITIGSGGQGGLFAPALFLGAMLGAGFGLAAQALLGGYVATPAAYALVGMGAVLAGAVRAPITGLMLPFEMAQDYHIVLPLMFAVVESTLIAQLIKKDSVYTYKLRLRGVELKKTEDVNLMRALSVADAMTPANELMPVRASDSIATLTEAFEASNHHGFVVLDEAGELYGVVTLSDLAELFAQKKPAQTIGEIATTEVVTVHPDDTLEEAMRQFGMKDVGRLPVVDRRNPRRLLGLLRRADVVSAYSNALTQRQSSEAHHERLRMEVATRTELLETSLDDGDRAVGKSIRELNVPDDCVIIALRRGDRTLVPRGNTALRAGDRIIALCAPTAQTAFLQSLRGPAATPSAD